MLLFTLVSKKYFTASCNCESRSIFCMLVESDKMNRIVVKQARNEKNPIEVFRIFLHNVEELASVKSIF
jgi:hypothetical protein